ncbi:hypothetical protein Tsubulata_001357 [Turnera subulata]|uniref:N-acetyltransferase domain-containing protein n=1 Tax=Turnera subulata TaxID=218843 RepID=A0A9Q0FJL9_9ROSI|nr:hypothetical protein Tsubulata_001357 [Turnera subulata]
MPHSLPCYLQIPKCLCREPSSCIRKFARLHCYRTCQKVSDRRGYAVKCSSTTTSTSPPGAAQQVCTESRRSYEDKREDFEYLVEQFGWKVRRLAEDQHEIREVVKIQAEAFHTPMVLFDDMFFEFFKAEVLSGLLYKLKNSPPDRYACLVAEPAADSPTSQSKLVGIVDVTALRDRDVLQHLTGAEEYLYISGIAVSKSFRRQRIGSALLKACDVLSILWGFEYLALRAYEDDLGARQLYTNAGYKIVSSDPLWLSLMGRKRRVLMIKRLNLIG